MKIKDIMTTNVITAKTSDTIKSVILKLRRKNITGVPILDDNGKVVGVFSETDIMKQLPDILNEADQIPLIDVKELTSAPVGMVMGRPVQTIKPEDSVRDAAIIVLEKYVHRLPVVDENNKLVGLVSLGDILKALANYKPQA